MGALEPDRLFFFRSLVLFCVLSAAAAAQSSIDEVHVMPRISQTQSAQGNQLDPSLDAQAARIRKDVDLVLVPVTITDDLGRLVLGLDRENFQVFDGNHRQDISHFSREDSPISVGIVFDMSGSMKSKIERAREAVKQFCQTANPQDEYFLVTFADRPQLVVDFTSNVDSLQNALLTATTQGRTALLDAIYMGITKMRGAKYSRRALLVISDGGDNRSRYSQHEIGSLIKETDTMIYTIGIHDPVAVTLEEALGPLLLEEMSEETGGRIFPSIR